MATCEVTISAAIIPTVLKEIPFVRCQNVFYLTIVSEAKYMKSLINNEELSYQIEIVAEDVFSLCFYILANI